MFSQRAHFELPQSENEAKWTGTYSYKREYTKHTGEREYNALLQEIASTKQEIINLQESQKNGYAKVNKRETSFSLSIENKQLITTGIKLLTTPQNQTNLNLILAKISNTGNKDLTLRAKFVLNQSNNNEAGEAYTQAIESLSSENAQILIDAINKLSTKASSRADSQSNDTHPQTPSATGGGLSGDSESSEGEANEQTQEKEAILTTDLMPRGLIVSKYEMIGKLNYDSNTLIANITNNHQSQRVKNELIFTLNKNSGIWLLFVSKFYAKPHATPIKAAIEAHANIEMQIIGEQ